MAFKIANNLRGGEVIELVSDLGGGKTTFTRGLVSGLGSKEPVASPTFTISREYTGGRFNVYHFDFYRLNEAGVMADELAEIINLPDSIVVVEWGEVVKQILPADRLQIRFTATGDQARRLSLEYPTELNYLLENV